MAEVVVDVLNTALGTTENFANDAPPNSRAIEVGASRVRDLNLAYALRTFGRPERSVPCDCERTKGPALPQSLYLMADPELLERVKAKIYVHKAEREFLKGFGSDLVKVDNHSTPTIGRLTLTFMHTPGHTPGSQCFLIDGRLVSGDTLFIGSCGRTDLPGSDPSEMYYSLTQRLGALPESTVLLPGHNYGGASSTLGDEKRGNPFMRFPSLGDFLRVMGGGRTAGP